MYESADFLCVRVGVLVGREWVHAIGLWLVPQDEPSAVTTADRILVAMKEWFAIRTRGKAGHYPTYHQFQPVTLQGPTLAAALLEAGRTGETDPDRFVACPAPSRFGKGVPHGPSSRN